MARPKGTTKHRNHIEIVCKQCQVVFKEYASNNRKFCSKSCSGAFNKNALGVVRSEETRKKISEANYRRFSKKENHPQWKGGINRQNIGYRELHRYISLMLGKPNKCSGCGKVGYGQQIHWANIDHAYSKDPNDWIRLCAGCHGRYDRDKKLRVRIKN